MLIRIVRMTFHHQHIDDFLTLFKQSQEMIRTFEGCNYVELLQDASQNNVFVTYSHWNNEQALENYRKSLIFKQIWSKTKVLFSEKPEASSFNKIQ